MYCCDMDPGGLEGSGEIPLLDVKDRPGFADADEHLVELVLRHGCQDGIDELARLFRRFALANLGFDVPSARLDSDFH